MDSKITFSFGKNWMDYNRTVTQKEIDKAEEDLVYWVGKENIEGKRVLDLGSGSGIHSLGLLALGAKELVSFDYDPNSVTATTEHWEKKGRPENWKVMHGSILDKAFVNQLGQFDLVYSWGVLHHTGSMWDAINNALSMVRPGGHFFITIYKDDNYQKSIAIKQKYNAASPAGKRMIERKEIAKLMAKRAMHLKNPLAWNQKIERGMNIYHDLVDWLGGLPYEVASEDEILRWGRQNNLEMERILCKGNYGACNYYLFRKK
jgi:2-polyprenyl-6-hydroxyphenyl methylase/3-demethylubiquinone-9 3-methyltransferase